MCHRTHGRKTETTKRHKPYRVNETLPIPSVRSEAVSPYGSNHSEVGQCSKAESIITATTDQHHINNQKTVSPRPLLHQTQNVMAGRKFWSTYRNLPGPPILHQGTPSTSHMVIHIRFHHLIPGQVGYKALYRLPSIRNSRKALTRSITTSPIIRLNHHNQHYLILLLSDTSNLLISDHVHFCCVHPASLTFLDCSILRHVLSVNLRIALKIFTFFGMVLIHTTCKQRKVD